MATQVIAFPQRNHTPQPLPHNLLVTAPATSPAASSFTLAPAIPSGHRGLHLVTANTPRHLFATPIFQEDTQTRANRIVAQVEQEVARQATRQRQMHLMFTEPVRLPASVTSIETPAKVARRLFNALLSFALPA